MYFCLKWYRMTLILGPGFGPGSGPVSKGSEEQIVDCYARRGTPRHYARICEGKCKGKTSAL